MKSVSLGAQLQRSARVNRDIVLPTGERTNRTWPLCLTCFKEVDACKIEDISNVSCELRATCYHGTDTPHEDFYRVVFPIPLDGNPFEDSESGERNNWAVKRAMHDFGPFAPEHTLDTSKRK